jgi:DNA repair exonuclease SbcCD ATPase subunit
MSYGNNITEVVFDDGLINVSAANGCGKSSITEALTYNLYGKPYRDIKLKELINKTNKKGLFTECFFNIASEEYRIVRTMSPDSVKIYKNDQELELLSSKKLIQDEIDKILGIDYTLFKQILVLSVNQNKPFLKMQLQEKRDIVESIFNIKVFGEMLKSLKKDISGLKIQKDTNGKIITVLEESIKQMRNNITQTKKALENFDKQKLDDTTKEESTIKDISDRLTIYASELSSLETTLSTIKIESKEEAETNIRQFTKDIAEKLSSKTVLNKEIVTKASSKTTLKEKSEKLQKSISEYDLKKVDIEKDFEWLKKEEYQELETKVSEYKTENALMVSNNSSDKTKRKFLQDNDVCPTCYQSLEAIDGVDKMDTIDSLRITIEDREKKIADNTKNISELVLKIKTIKQNNESRSSKESELKVLTVERAGLEHELKEIQKQLLEISDEKIKEIQEEIIKIDSEVTVLNDGLKEKEELVKGIRTKEIQKQKIENDIKMIGLKISNSEKEMVECNNRILDIGKRKFEMNIEELEESFKGKCSEYKELYETTKTIDKDLNEALVVQEILSETGIKSFFMKKLIPLFNVKVNEYLNKFELPLKVIFDEQMEDKVFNMTASRFDPVGYDSLSGGEQKRVDISILFTFIEIVKMICNWNSNLLFIDELLDGAVDGEGLDKMMLCLKAMSKDNQSYYIISHRTFDTELFDRRIGIKKVNGFSRIEIE